MTGRSPCGARSVRPGPAGLPARPQLRRLHVRMGQPGRGAGAHGSYDLGIGVDCLASDRKGYNATCMTMPFTESLTVDTRKLVDYLLSSSSPRGRHKAAFFQRFGYTIENIPEFSDALREHGQSQQVTRIVDTPYGRRFYVDGPLRSPDGRNPQVRTVWQLEPDSQRPRLLTAFRRRK